MPSLPPSEPPVIGAQPPCRQRRPRSQVPCASCWPSLLSLCLLLFLADAVFSLADESLVLLFGTHILTVTRFFVGLPALLAALLIYVLIGVTPMVPKRLFLPVALYNPVAVLVLIPFAIYCYDRLQLVTWAISLSQFLVALGLLWWAQGGFKRRWPLVPEGRLKSARL